MRTELGDHLESQYVGLRSCKTFTNNVQLPLILL